MGNQISVKKYVSRTTVEKAVKEKRNRWESQTEELQQQAETVEESGRIFVRNLAYTVIEEDLKTEFEKVGWNHWIMLAWFWLSLRAFDV